MVAETTSSQRFGVSVRGQIIVLKLENLSMGMKADEMSSSDEELLLKLEPGKTS